MAVASSLKRLKVRLAGPVSQRVTSYFEPDLVAAVDEYGGDVGLRRAGAIRRAVILGLQADGYDIKEEKKS